MSTKQNPQRCATYFVMLLNHVTTDYEFVFWFFPLVTCS